MGSRVIVKNLPKHMSSERFRDTFGAKGTVTDAKLVSSKDGVFRRFGYIGYASESEARAAVEYFNNTYIDTSKIVVEFAKSPHDPSLPRPWSKHTPGSTAHLRANPALLAERAAAESRKRDERRSAREAEWAAGRARDDGLLGNTSTRDAKLTEFLEVVGVAKKGKVRTWENDDGLGGAAKEEEEALGGKKKSAKRRPDDAGVALDTPAGPVSKKAKTAKHSSPDLRETEENPPTKPRQTAPNPDVEMTDEEYMRSKMRRVLDESDEMPVVAEDGEEEDIETESDVEEAEAEGENGDEESGEAAETTHDGEPAEGNAGTQPDPPAAEDPNAPPPPELIAETGRLYIRNLPFTTSEEELRARLEAFGPVVELHMPLSRLSRRPTGTCFALFALPSNAIEAYEALNGSIFQGRILDIVPGKERPGDKEDEGKGAGKGGFKAERDKRRKKEGGESVWNTLFMNSDTVLESIAKTLGVIKAEILDPEAGNLAVRVAMAETHVIEETKKYLEDEGVSLSALETGLKKTRSTTVILVKNLPPHSQQSEISTMFARFGPLGRVVMPPTRTVALVEFAEATDAKRAYGGLAYARFHHVPLYLEWAPLGVFKEGSAKKAGDGADGKGEGGADGDAQTGALQTVALPAPEEDVPLPTATLFVKNLSFSTTDATLQRAFAAVGGVRSARVSTKPDPKNPRGPRLSMGFGFVEFAGKEWAMKAIKAMQGFVLDGHALEVKLSSRGATGETAKANAGKTGAVGDAVEPKGTKLLVRNVAFQATKRDLRELLGAFGQVKSVRMPKKFDGSHRGFAFVDFLTRQEAKAAFTALAGTHLYGRHLVCEWAEAEESVEELRVKEAKKFNARGEARKGKNLALGGEDEEMGAQGGGSESD
ncbi:RNA-binding domain-containing protein [Gonapodya prolifera JEL478]|uniref:RNA-binding domain-containing protein n=1 Tax=Gonapodya prolifera (strain JEL478) TaxID=1344416 RepID=A0A139ASM9_GONPJ|nr:RNA-binding domain-containing protein [Gonapodya prolifera JEL478]|eukprot:KXS19746.1 RNA-binding domain-containing protein [Gonapodya prolifera JEL478]